MRPIITLLTDFGTADGYVAQMKGVILSHAPDVTLVDITHDIAPQDVTHARFVVERYWRRFPPGTVHLVVVDPGVGSQRAALAVSADHRYLLGPDNGVLTGPLRHDTARVVSLEVPHGASPTFHGRDVFAPVAAAIAEGTPMTQLGAPCDHAIQVDWPAPVAGDGGRLQGEVLIVDRFGNAITNLPGDLGATSVTFDTCELPVRRTYAEVGVGESLALVGSSGHVEIAVREGSAAQRFALRRGTRVVLNGARTPVPDWVESLLNPGAGG
jgi:S-adenosyl-L-methionine hydrolase (adenosine-forming)